MTTTPCVTHDLIRSISLGHYIDPGRQKVTRLDHSVEQIVNIIFEFFHIFQQHFFEFHH